MDANQYEIGAGPCLSAYREQAVFRIESTADEQRWPEFCRRAAQAGICSTLSLPLVVGGDGLGALNLYSRRPGAFSEAAQAAGVAFASYASVALANARIYWRTQRLVGQLQEALSTRGVIEQAKCILIAEQGCTDDEAFGLLVRASQRRHEKVRDVAARVVEQARQRRQDNRP